MTDNTVFELQEILFHDEFSFVSPMNHSGQHQKERKTKKMLQKKCCEETYKGGIRHVGHCL